MSNSAETTGGIVMYESKDGLTRIDVTLESDTVWLSAPQMPELFQRDVTSIRHTH